MILLLLLLAFTITITHGFLVPLLPPTASLSQGISPLYATNQANYYADKATTTTTTTITATLQDPPGPPPHPLIGNLLGAAKAGTLYDYHQALIPEYGKVVKVRESTVVSYLLV